MSPFTGAIFLPCVNTCMAKTTWQLAFERRYAEQTGRIPLILQGGDPARDMAVFDALDPGYEYWALYDMSSYDTEYWRVFLKLFNRDARNIKLSTALVVSERIMGDEIYGMAIPDAWLLSVERQPDLTAARII